MESFGKKLDTPSAEDPKDNTIANNNPMKRFQRAIGNVIVGNHNKIKEYPKAKCSIANNTAKFKEK